MKGRFHPQHEDDYDLKPSGELPSQVVDEGLCGSAEPFLEYVLEILEHGSVAFAWLRESEERVYRASEDPREIDLLVCPEHLSSLAATLAEHGFYQIPGWGHEPHHFFVAYDYDSGTWWKLDVVTDLRFGHPIRTLRAGDPEGCLRRRDGNHRQSPEDELLGLLLHCLLDRAEFRVKHRSRLLALRKELDVHPDAFQRAVGQVERWLAPALRWDVLDRILANEDWAALARYRSAVVWQLFRADPVGTLWRQIRGRVLRLSRPLLFALRRRGSVVVLLGPDGAGKTTLARALSEEKPLRARRIYMGRNRDAVGVSLSTTGRVAEQGHPLHGSRSGPFRRITLGMERANRFTEQWYRGTVVQYHRLRGRLVMCDRYIYEARPGKPSFTRRRRLRRWLMRAAAPRPDLIVVLDAPGDVLYERKREHSRERLEQMRCTYLALRDRFPQTVVVDATQGPDLVKRRVVSLIWPLAGSRGRPADAR